MSIQQKTGLEEQIPEQSVADYLERHPDFFRRHPELTERLRLPHECGDAVSLVQYQVRLLRDQHRRLERRLEDLVQVARDNDRLADRLQRLTLELMDTRDLDSTLDTVADGLRLHFGADFVAMRLRAQGYGGDRAEFRNPNDPGFSLFREVFRAQRPRCGHFHDNQRSFLFGDSGTRVQSMAVVPLQHDGVTGLLAIGSLDAERYHSSQGTVFLRQLGDLTSHAVAARL